MDDPPSLYLDPDYQMAQGWPFTALHQACDGNMQALLYLAFVVSNNGNGPEALRYYRKAARDFNNLEATWWVIKIYEYGLWGVDADLVKACQWMKNVLMTIESTQDQWKHPKIRRDIIVNYGWYMLGARTSALDGQPQLELPENKRNVTDGLKWLERAAEMGEGDVASTLGNIYMTGENPKIPQNYEKATKLLQKAAELGDGECTYLLSVSYMIGIVPVDEDKHRFWLKKAADLGYEEAVDLQEFEMNVEGHGFKLGIQRKAAKKQIKKVEREEGIESVLTTDDSTKCSNPSCEANETDETGLFKVCVVCRHVKYCSKDCQKVHWKSGHKEDCPRLKDQKEMMKKINIDMIKNQIVL
mmetsp:Transcript_7463/g.17903  ORF Transcript_7463/g.17903 Transcript_7463/m.17903 type:complete len:357 (+) Transcript_7463:179-1249(+)